MTAYIIRRALYTIPLVIGVCLITFLLFEVLYSPELRARRELGRHADKKQIQEIIERAGLRGARRGAARVSERHANFLVNSGGASARQVWELARLVARQVRRVHGVRLEPEVERWGDFSSPGRGT